MNYWTIKNQKVFSELKEKNTYENEHILENMFNEISDTLNKYKDYEIHDSSFDITNKYESLCVSIINNKNKIYIECFPNSSDDVFESLLIIEDKNTKDILLAQTNTLKNNLYELKLKFNE